MKIVGVVSSKADAEVIEFIAQMMVLENRVYEISKEV